jgi:hypothetical protein
MSDVNAETGDKPEVEGEQGNADAAGAADSSGSDAGAPNASATGAEAPNDAAALTGATSSDVVDGGEQGNAAAGANQSSQPCLGSGENGLAGELPNDAVATGSATEGAIAEVPNGAGTAPAGDAIAAESEPATGSDAAALTLRERVALQAQAAATAGMTDEANVMAWIHNHLMGARRVIEGCGEFHISDEGQNLIAETAKLL